MGALRPNDRPAGRRRTRTIADSFAGLEFRLVGPFRGGRVVAVAGHPTEPLTFYMGSTGGGVWKTTDAGRFWVNVSDKYFRRASVGAIAVSSSDPNVVYVGMGETCIRENVSHGDGTYKTTDGGRTWRHVGLRETRNISTVCVDPRDPDTVYVAAFGHVHGRHRERGVFRSRDGGATWKRVLYRGDRTGAIDLSIDPSNPRILYAAMWEAVRLPHTMTSGGPGSGLFKSTDGGETWIELTRRPGFPGGVLGRIGIAVAPSRPDRVLAIVEADAGGIYRSDDAGESWTRVCDDAGLWYRAWYYMHIFVDPRDADTVWVLNVDQWRSIDGGKSFQQFSVPHSDTHDLWIDPKDPRRMIQGSDGGAAVTLNAGETWSTLYNQPTAEMYHVTTDDRFPYRIYGTQQDNTAIALPSRARIMGINDVESYEIGGGESGWIAVRPDDPEIVYAGSFAGYLTRYDHRIGQARNIAVWPEMTIGHAAKDVRHRFQWTAPTVLSPHDPNTLYHCGDQVFRSRDEGQTWECISPDLTRNDPSKLGPSGGPVTKDQSGAEYYCTVFAFAESPVRKGVLWAGSDDGLIHVSPDGGETWRKATPRGLPAWSTVSTIEPSPFEPNSAYAAIERHMLDDFRPFLYKTTDLGRTWTRISSGIPDDEFCRVIRCDPQRRGVLYAGTETGLYVSHDDGRRWWRVQANLPFVPIHDLAVRANELVLATHGRSFWALDDIAPLRDWREPAPADDVVLFPPALTYRVRSKGGFSGKPIPGRNYRSTDATMLAYELRTDPVGGDPQEAYLDAGKNPPTGVTLHYWLRATPSSAITLSFHDASGRRIREFTSASDPDRKGKDPRVADRPGICRFVWDMRYPPAARIEGDFSVEAFEGGLSGPQILPGRYIARLKVAGRTLSADFEVRLDPRVRTDRNALRDQFELLLRIRDKISQAHDAVRTIRTVRAEIDDQTKSEGRGRRRRPSALVVRLRAGLLAIEEELIQWRARNRGASNWPTRLNAKLCALAAAVGQADARPTAAQLAVFDELASRVDAERVKLDRLIRSDVERLRALARLAATPHHRGRPRSTGPRSAKHP